MMNRRDGCKKIAKNNCPPATFQNTTSILANLYTLLVRFLLR
jgi:hypothetical protein